jgi:hypothetical protein
MTAASPIEARWSKFEPTDARIGVRYLPDDTVFVPDTFLDRMNSIAFYIAMHKPPDVTLVDGGHSMTRNTYSALLHRVDQKVVGDCEPVYSDERLIMSQSTDRIVAMIELHEKRLRFLREILATRTGESGGGGLREDATLAPPRAFADHQ